MESKEMTKKKKKIQEEIYKPLKMQKNCIIFYWIDSILHDGYYYCCCENCCIKLIGEKKVHPLSAPDRF